jgi:hypothetical protein
VQLNNIKSRCLLLTWNQYWQGKIRRSLRRNRRMTRIRNSQEKTSGSHQKEIKGPNTCNVNFVKGVLLLLCSLNLLPFGGSARRFYFIGYEQNVWKSVSHTKFLKKRARCSESGPNVRIISAYHRVLPEILVSKDLIPHATSKKSRTPHPLPPAPKMARRR